MKEKNKDSLKKAIENLPEYSPKDKLWDKLASNMDDVQADAVLHEAIENLSTYPAPDTAWSNIEKELPAVRRRLWPKLLTAAATIAILVSFILNYQAKSFEKESIEIAHVEKRVSQSQFVSFSTEAVANRDSAFKAIIRAQKKNDENAKQILAELEKLDESRKRLKSRLSKYDINKQLEEKLNRIETESMELQQAYLSTI